MEPQAGLSVNMIPGEPPKFVHNHTASVIFTMSFPSNDEVTCKRIQEIFNDSSVVQEVQRLVASSGVVSSVLQEVMQILASRGVLYENHLRKFSLEGNKQ